MSDLPENGVNEEVTPDITEEDSKEAFNLKKEVFEWIYTIVVALAIAFLIKGFLFDVVRVDGPSMETTLLNNDRLIITKIGYKPQAQDIIILDSAYKAREDYYEMLEENNIDVNFIEKAFNLSVPQNLKRRYYVKRIIGLPGQTIDIVGGKVLVDGKVLDEPYISAITTITDHTVDYPVTVDDDSVFVMGDNRPYSKDSRSSELGQVPIKAILGKAQIRIWPLNKIGLVK